MIDTHCHILPGVDDGPKTMEGAIRMATDAVEQGITTIIATPHHRERYYTNTAKHISRKIRLFNSKLKRRRIPLTVLPGQEYHLTERYRSEHRAGHLQTLAGSSYLLVELPTRKVPDYFPDFLSYIKGCGIHAVIAHPERNQAIIEQPEIVSGWSELYGVLLQVTTQSLVGYFGDKVAETAAYLCKNHLVHLLGTDAHNTVRRKFYFQEGCKVIERICGPVYLKGLQNHAEDLIRGREIIDYKPPS